MKHERIASRSGAPTVTVDGVFLHSRYDPLREAQRQLNQVNIPSRTPRAIVVIGEGIPYLSDAIASQYPDISVFAAVLGEPSPEFQVPQIDVTGLESGGLRRWLRSRVSHLDAAALELVPWEPARRLAPELIAQAERETLEVVQNASAEIATIGSFGRRWLANAVRSAILVDHRSELPHPGTTATLATSGPSLEQIIAGGRIQFPGMLTVTSSAWSTLASCDIAPAVVVHTDGGYWATRYLRTAHHHHNQAAPVVVMPAHAAVPDSLLRRSHHHLGFLSTGWLGEALHADHQEWRRVPEAPTVTATALQLLHGLLPEGHIYLAGLDLMSRGVLGHARPHPNDRLITTTAHRLRPEVSIGAERILHGTVTMEEWPDGVVGYRSQALESFLPEITRILSVHRTTGLVESLSPGRHNWPLPDDGAPQPAPPRSYRRAPQAERIHHARHVLDMWRTAAVDGTWDDTQREILFHLAPVEVLQALRGDLDGRTVAAAARDSLDTLLQLLERISPR